MYEIWLMLNIVWEILLSTGMWLWATLVLWLGLMAINLGSSKVCWGRGLLKAAILGLIAGAMTFVTLPTLVDSSMSELRYWVDWVALAGMSAGIGGAVAMLSWPVWTRLSHPTQ